MVFCFSKTKVKTPKGIFDKLRHIQKIIILPTGLNNQVDKTKNPSDFNQPLLLEAKEH